MNGTTDFCRMKNKADRTRKGSGQEDDARRREDRSSGTFIDIEIPALERGNIQIHLVIPDNGLVFEHAA